MQRTDSFEKTWCWEWLKVGGKGDDRGWDGWMASPTQWTWVWVSFGSWWWTGKPGVLLSMGSQRVGHDWATDLQYACLENPMDRGTWWVTFQGSQSVNHHWATNTFTFFFHIWISRVEFGGNNQFHIFIYFHSQLDSIKNFQTQNASSGSNQGWNLCHLNWKHWALTTGQPVKSQTYLILK